MTQTKQSCFPVYNMSKDVIISGPEMEHKMNILLSILDDLKELHETVNKLDNLLEKTQN